MQAVRRRLLPTFDLFARGGSIRNLLWLAFVTIGTESVRIEPQGMVPPTRIGLHRHPSERQRGAGFDAVTRDFHIASGHPGSGRSGRTQPQRLLQNLDRKTQAANVIRGKLAVAERGGFGSDALLHVGMTAERP